MFKIEFIFIFFKKENKLIEKSKKMTDNKSNYNKSNYNEKCTKLKAEWLQCEMLEAEKNILKKETYRIKCEEKYNKYIYECTNEKKTLWCSIFSTH
tara:strand:+ start:696 stop:983 length:288 start_codon:yes stop_codon:yes gene_type:complete